MLRFIAAANLVYEALTAIRKDRSRIGKSIGASVASKAGTHWHQPTTMLRMSSGNGEQAWL
jgi:hypothetical protein